MKKILFLLMLMAFLPGFAAHAQPMPVVVTGASTDALLSAIGISDKIYYAMMIADLAEQSYNTAMQVVHWEQQTERAIRNLANIGEITDFKDFMEWYNRQLYLERQANEEFDKMSIKIGKKNYKLTDIDGWSNGMKENYVDYWDKEFTAEQNKEMWLKLGLTSSNYAYVQTWKEKEKKLAKKFLTSTTVQNNEYIKNVMRNSKVLARLAKDKDKPDDEKMGEKEILAMTAETLAYNNKTLNEISGQIADIQEAMAVEMYLKQADFNGRALSDWPEESMIRPLTEGKGGIY